MNIGRIFVSAIVRRVAYVLVALLVAVVGSLLGAGEARAQSTTQGCVRSSPTSWSWACDTAGQASIQAESVNRDMTGQCAPDKPPQYKVFHQPESKRFEKVFQCGRMPANGNDGGGIAVATYVTLCEPGTGQWRDDLGRCFDESECTQRNGAENGFPDTPQPKAFESLCLDGCDYRMDPSHGQCTSVSGAPDAKICFGSFQFSGQTCTVPPNQGQPDPDEGKEASGEVCTPTGDGLKMCVDPGGNECISTPKGAMVCWGTGETGSKVTGNEQQTRGPGTTEPTPTPPTPPETFDPAQKSDPVTTTTTSPTTTTTTTTVTNGTTHGTVPPGTPGFGPRPDSPDISDMEGSASGGSSCTQPVVTTGDPVMGMVARQAWETRCAVEKSAKVSVTGDITNCKSPFSVQGPEDDENVQMMKAQRAQICPGEADSDAENGNGDAFDQSSMDGPESPEASGVFKDIEVGADGLDTSGLGFSRTCPVMPQVQVFGTVIQFDNSVMCDWLELGGVFVLILAALASVRIMAGASS